MQMASVTANTFFESLIVHYGFHSRLCSDQSRNFKSSVIRELCKIAGVKMFRTIPYHPKGNGMPERYFQTLLNMLVTLEHKRQTHSS